MKKKRLILYIIATICIVLFIALVTVYFLRNTIIRSVLEKSLSKRLETEVQFEGFNLKLFSKALDIDSFSIVKKDDNSVYLVKTGKIEIALGPLLPIIFDRHIEIYNLHFNKVHFLVPIQGKVNTASTSASAEQKQPDTDLSDLFNSIDINTLLADYTGTLQSIEASRALLENTEGYGATLDSQLSKIEDINNTVAKEVEQFSSVSVNSLEEANDTLQQAKKSYATIEKAYNDGLEIKDTVLSNKNAIENSISNLENIVNKDVAKITKDIANPSSLATELSIAVLTQMIGSPVTKYHKTLSAVLEFLQGLQDKDSTNNTSSSSFPLEQFLATLTASIEPYISPQLLSKSQQKETHIIAAKTSKSDDLHTDISVPTVQSVPTISSSTTIRDIEPAQVPEVSSVPDIVVTNNSSEDTKPETSYLIAQNNTNSTSNKQETSSKNKKKMTIDIQSFLLSVGIKEEPLFTVYTSKLTISDKIYTRAEPIFFYISNTGEVITDSNLSTVNAGDFVGEGEFSLNPKLPMLVTSITVGATPITINTGLEYIQVKELRSNTSYQLDLTMNNAKNGKATLFLANKDLYASPTADTDIVANAINDASSIDITTDISIKEGKIDNFTFNTNVIDAIILPLIEKNLQALTSDIQDQLKKELYKQATVDLDEAQAIVDEQLQKVDINLQNTEDIKQLQQDNVDSINNTVQNYVTQQANEEAAKIQKELEKQTENIIEDLGSSFGF